MESPSDLCPLCRNHCPLDALQCDKGRKHQAKQQPPPSPAALAADNSILDVYLQYWG